MLQEQLEERAKERIRIEEQQECERLMMLKETERLRQEELRQQVEKKMRAQQLVAEVGCRTLQNGMLFSTVLWCPH